MIHTQITPINGIDGKSDTADGLRTLCLTKDSKDDTTQATQTTRPTQSNSGGLFATLRSWFGLGSSSDKLEPLSSPPPIEFRYPRRYAAAAKFTPLILASANATHCENILEDMRERGAFLDGVLCVVNV